ncbi:MAG: hypothetical protein HY308_11115 [Gammaproteobacteria bacterium]|nr:hypothetical protein [Gammaproteobacteria bacterium]
MNNITNKAVKKRSPGSMLHVTTFTTALLMTYGVLANAQAETEAPVATVADHVGGSVEMQSEIDAIMIQNQGARQLSEDTVELKPGVSVTVVPKEKLEKQNQGAGQLTTQAQTAATPSCGYGVLCLFQHTSGDNFGYRMNLYKCGEFVYLWDHKMGNGTQWNNQVSAIINNQTTGTTSHFWDWENNGWSDVQQNTAYTYWPDLTKISRRELAPTRDMNDVIDAIWVCG